MPRKQEKLRENAKVVYSSKHHDGDNCALMESIAMHIQAAGKFITVTS